MAVIWQQSEEGWAPVVLGQSVVDLGQSGGVGQAPGIRLCRWLDGNAPERWLVMAPPGAGLRVAGCLVAAGLRVLQDRDELQWNGAMPIFFSSENLAVIQPYPSGDRPVHCARCKLPIEPGSPAVQCPRATCGLWYHQSEEFPCWTYAPICVESCGQPTDLDADYQWQPES